MSDIQHAHLYGMREAKYDWLLSHDVLSTDWNEIEPQKPFHLFIPQNNDLFDKFREYWNITKIMPVNSAGIVTGQDANTIGFSYEEVETLSEINKTPIDSITHVTQKSKKVSETAIPSKIVAKL